MSEDHEYNETFVAGLQYMWGQGFLSPGGRDEVANILAGLDLTGSRVLDIGCGLGAIDVLLVEEHGADYVVCIDVDAALIQQAKRLGARSAHADRLDFRLVSSGPLPFDENEFDLVFSKDAIVHIPDKAACYREIRRVLRHQGWLAISDWYGAADQITPEMKEWLEVVRLSFSLGTIEEAAETLSSVGFVDIKSHDRNRWYAHYMAQELGSISGDNYSRLVSHIGEAAAAQRLASSTLKKTVVDQGQLRPGHLRAINQKQDSTE